MEQQLEEVMLLLLDTIAIFFALFIMGILSKFFYRFRNKMLDLNRCKGKKNKND